MDTVLDESCWKLGFQRLRKGLKPGVQWTPGVLNVPHASSIIFLSSITNPKSFKFVNNIGGYLVEEFKFFLIFIRQTCRGIDGGMVVGVHWTPGVRYKVKPFVYIDQTFI